MIQVFAMGMALFLAADRVSAEVAVHFEPVERFTDLSLSGAETPAVQESLLKQLEAHIQQLAKHFLPSEDKLDVAIEDIDMAGAYEPWQTPNAINTRFIRDIYPPRIKLNYRWYGKDGQLKVEKQEQLSDLNYLILLDSARYQNNDPLRYEKAMLDRWFGRVFGGGDSSR